MVLRCRGASVLATARPSVNPRSGWWQVEQATPLGTQTWLEKELVPETRCLEIVGQGVGRIDWWWPQGTEPPGFGPFRGSPLRGRSRLHRMPQEPGACHLR